MIRVGRRNDILDLFTRLVAERGYDGTHFGDIAAELGISKGTIVHHFGTKDRMLAMVHETYMLARYAEAEKIVAALQSPVETLAALLHAFVHYQRVDRFATIAFQRETVRFRGDKVMARARRLRRQYFRLVRGVIQDGVDQGAFRAVDAHLTTLALFGSAHWAWTWFDLDGPQSVSEVAAAFTDVYLGGLLVDRDKLDDLTRRRELIETVVLGAIEAVAAEDFGASESVPADK